MQVGPVKGHCVLITAEVEYDRLSKSSNWREKCHLHLTKLKKVVLYVATFVQIMNEYLSGMFCTQTV